MSINPYLHKLNIENFRVFEENTTFDFAPLTFLIGKNNAGKSSLIKFIELMKTNFGNLSTLDLREGINLGSFTGATYNRNANNIICSIPIRCIGLKVFLIFKVSFSLKFNEGQPSELGQFDSVTISFNETTLFFFNSKLATKDNLQGVESFIQINLLALLYLYKRENKGKDNLDGLKPKVENDFYHFRLFEYWLSTSENLRIPEKITFQDYFKNPVFKYYTINSVTEQKEYQDFSEIERSIFNEIFGGNLFTIFHSFKSDLSKVGFDRLPQLILECFIDRFIERTKQTNISWKYGVIKRGNPKKAKQQIHIENTEAYSRIEKYLLPDLQATYYELLHKLRDTNIIKSSRSNQQRFYMDNGKRQMNSQLLFIYDNGILKNEKILEFLKKWIKEFDIGDDIFIQRSVEGIGSELIIINNDEKINIADFGFGTGQLIPILLQIAINYTKSEGESILILEEPEANLHPNLQSKLAEMLVYASKKLKIQFVVETHSEYLIRNLQLLTAKGNISTNDSVIYYFNDSKTYQETGQKVKKISIQKNGTLNKPFGKGFLDEADNIAMKLFSYSNNRK